VAPTSTELFQVEEDGNVLIVTFSADPLNYLNTQSIVELEILAPEWRDSHHRAIVLQSNPDEQGFMTHFSAEELSDMVSTPQSARYSAEAVRRFKVLLDQFTLMPKAVIAAMNGDTMGGGLELAMACDIRIGEIGDYRYGHPEVRLGILPGAGGTQRLARMIGFGQAVNFILRAQVVRPEVAHQLGLVHELVADAPARAREIAAEIAQFPPMGVAAAKRALYMGNERDIQAGFEVENLAWLETMESDDVQVAMADYIGTPFDKRRDWIEGTEYPKYQGH